MQLKISANRMNLLKFRNRLKFAIRGHKLLKDKQEQLTREFNQLIFSLSKLRDDITARLKKVYSLAKICYSQYPLEVVLRWCEEINRNQNYEIASKKVYKLNLKCDVLQLIDKQKKNDELIVSVDPYFNLAVKEFVEIFPKLLELAYMEHLCELIAKDLETTRRRVNALEYILIPQIKNNIKFIVDKLNELERTNITQLMRVKQLYGGMS